jgi:TolB-like protein
MCTSTPAHLFVFVVFSIVLTACAQDGGNAVIQQKRMAFERLRESGLPREDAEEFSMYLQTALTEATQWEVYDFAVTESLILERGGSEECSNLQCEIINGQMLGVDYICYGSIETIGKTYSLTVQIADVISGRQVANVAKFFKGSRSVFVDKTIPLVARQAAEAVIGKKNLAAPSASTYEQQVRKQSNGSFGDVRGYLSYGDSASDDPGSRISTRGKLAFGYLVAGRRILPDDALRYSYQLQSYLADVGACAMLYIDEMERLMQIRGGNLRCGNQKCAMSVGRLLGVDFMGYGKIRRRCSRTIIQAYIVSVETGNVITQDEQRFRGREIVFLTEIIPQIAYKLGEVLERNRFSR